jgi:hypothetical protein
VRRGRKTYGAVHGSGGRDGALGAPVARVGSVLDGDLVGGRGIGLGVGGGQDR